MFGDWKVAAASTIQVGTQGAAVDTLAREGTVESPAVTISIARDLAEITEDWRKLEPIEIESPGQSLAFADEWLGTVGAGAEQFHILASLGGVPVMLLPLMVMRPFGLTVLTWLFGRHVGCNAPLIDSARLAAATDVQLAAMWRGVRNAVKGVDLLYLPFTPVGCPGLDRLFGAVGHSITGETLYRTQFKSFAECEATQRNRSRRKHDKQHAQKLAAKGEVSFEELKSGDDIELALGTMFEQRAARFQAQGICNPFAAQEVRDFYGRVFAGGGDLKGVMHVLRLDGEVIATRYNLVKGDRMFCLISSMSDDPALQAGAPGKHCLVNVMQTVFDQGYTMFDMGAGLTDEKRQWCNVQIPLEHRYLPLTLRGRIASAAHRGFVKLRRTIKEHEKSYELVRKWRQFRIRMFGS